MKWSPCVSSAISGKVGPRTPLVWGHRGASGVAPENTLRAFRLGLDAGATGTELDVRRTADDRLAVHHDAELADGRLIIDLTMAELPSEIPPLEAVLELHANAAVNVEIKSDPDDKDFDPAYPVVDLVLALLVDEPTSRTGARIVTSFDHNAIATVRQRCVAPDQISTGLITMNPLIGTSFERLRTEGHRAVMVHHRVITSAMVEKASDFDVFLGAWTVNSEKAMDRMRRLGVDAIMTDTPEVGVVRYGAG